MFLDSPSKKSPLISELEKIHEAEGALLSDFTEDKLMHSVLAGDKDKIEDGKLISNAINMGIGSFTPDIMFEKMVEQYSMAKRLYGETLIRQLTGYDPNYIDKNIHIPEFRKEIEKAIQSKVDELKHHGYIDESGFIVNKGLELASITMYLEELDKLEPKGFTGTKSHKREQSYGDRNSLVDFRGQRYKDLAIRRSVKFAQMRGHKKIELRDLKAFNRKNKGSVSIVYALDASGSMKGRKIEQCKKAGIALAYAAMQEKDKVGLIVFGDKIRQQISPTQNFTKLLKTITNTRASRQTNIAQTIEKAIELFHGTRSKHLILITDAMPTLGASPAQKSLDAASLAKASGVSISLIGIELSKKGEQLAKKLVEIGGGKLYRVRDLEEIDTIILEDYYSST